MLAATPPRGKLYTPLQPSVVSLAAFIIFHPDREESVKMRDVSKEKQHKYMHKLPPALLPKTMG